PRPPPPAPAVLRRPRRRVRRLRVELCPADDRDPPRRGDGRHRPRAAWRRHLLPAVPDRAPAAAGPRARHRRPAGAADRRARPYRRAVRGLSAGGAVGLPDHHSRNRHGEGGAAADRGHHLEPHARDPRRPEAPLLLSLGWLSRCRPRTGDPAPQGARRWRGAQPRGRRLRSEAARNGPVQASRHRRDDRLDPCADGARRHGPRPPHRRRYAGHIAEVPGRHRPHPGQRGTADSQPGPRRARLGGALSRAPGMTVPPPDNGERQDAGPGGGRLVENIMHFARVLRAAGLPIGPGQVLKAVEAVRAVEITDRQQFYWALHAALVNRRDQQDIFDQAFHVFWRNPRILDRMLGLVLPTVEGADKLPENAEPLSRRLAEALAPAGDTPRTEEAPQLE